jgi:hypothetical protein
MRVFRAVLIFLLLAVPARADMYPDASNAKLPDARTNLGAVGHVATNVALAAARSSDYPTGVWRDDYAAGNGAPPLYFQPQTGTCASHGFASDGGTCVDAAGGSSWQVPASPTIAEDIREWGMVAGTGSLAANGAAMAAIFATPRPLDVLVPQGTFGIPCGTTYNRTVFPLVFVGQGLASKIQLGASACVADSSWWSGGLFSIDSVSGSGFRDLMIDLNGVTAVGVGAAPTATSTASSISGTTLTVGGTLTGTWAVGEIVTGSTTASGTYITALGSGSGGAGTYTVNKSQTVASTYLNGTPGAATSTATSVSGTTLTVGGTITGTWAVGQTIWGAGIASRAYHITARGSGSGGAGTYTLDVSPGTIAAQTMFGLPDLISGIYVHAKTASVLGFTVSGVSIINGKSPTLFAVSTNADSNDITNLLIKDNYLQMTPSTGMPGIGGNECIGMAGLHNYYNPQILHNNCGGSGMQLIGVKGGILTGNNVEAFAFGAAVYCTDFNGSNPSGKSWLVYGNHLHDGATTLDVSGTGTPMSGMEWHCPTSSIIGNLIENNGGPGITNSADNVSILGNHIRDNGANPVYVGMQGGILLEALGATGDNSKGVVIDANNIFDDGSGYQKWAVIIGGSMTTNGAVNLGSNSLSGPSGAVLNNSPNGGAVIVANSYNMGDDNIIYNPSLGAGVVNIRTGTGGTDYYFSFRNTGEFDAGWLKAAGTPTSGSGGLYLCMAADGSTYKKASCP